MSFPISTHTHTPNWARPIFAGTPPPFAGLKGNPIGQSKPFCEGTYWVCPARAPLLLVA